MEFYNNYTLTFNMPLFQNFPALNVGDGQNFWNRNIFCNNFVMPKINLSYSFNSFYAKPFTFTTDISTGNSTGFDSFTYSKRKNSAFDLSGNNYHLRLSSAHERSLDKVKQIFNKNKSKYEAVSRATGVPAELVCAIHYRESGCNFNTYLHNGDPLGKETVHYPKGKYFTDWTDAAIDAIKSKSYYKKVKSNDINTQYEYAELYNGKGYRKRGLSSPYVWSGTDKYTSGKFVADGKFDPNCKDKQVGVAAILDTLYSA